MIPVYVTNEPMPASPELIAAAAQANPNALIVHVDAGYPGWLTDAGIATPGYHEIEELGDTLEGQKAARLQAEAEALAAVYDTGFPCVTSGLAGHRLQVRPGTSDQANWLTFYTDCQEAIAAGQGAATCPIPIRTMENVNVNVSFNDGATEMRAMRGWGATVMAADWAVNDAIEAATSAEALAAITLVSAPE